MRNFVISLKNNNEKRKDHIHEEFSKQNISFEFFDAITPNQNDSILLQNKLKISHPLTNNEIACSLSHFMIWKKIVDENIPFAAIFEDDIYLGADANLFLMSKDWIDPEIDIIKLEKGWQRKIKTSLFASETIGNRRMYRLASNHYGTAGYIIFNKGARFLLNYYSKIQITTPIDALIFGSLLSERNFNVQQLLPTLCVQDFILNNGHINFPSAIAVMPDVQPDKKIKRSVTFKIKREIKRTFIKTYHALRSIEKKALLLINRLWQRPVTFK